MFAFVRKLLFLMPAERAHYFTMNVLKWWIQKPFVLDRLRKRMKSHTFYQPSTKMGIRFHNPVGLAAGFDKNASYFNELFLLGFGFVEIGTVTPKPQSGNPKPRLFRLSKNKALLNRMGFNNDGVDAVVERLKGPREEGLVIGGNIGKNKNTPNADAASDYLICFEKLHPYVDYFVVNVSSPNTPGLRELQQRDSLTELLNALQTENSRLDKPKPILLKIAPDMSWEQIAEVAEIVEETDIAGLITNNTTISRDGLRYTPAELESLGNGGISGEPLRLKSRAVLQKVLDQKTKRFALVSSGGVVSGNEAHYRLAQGADLVQIWTGFVYKGPAIVKNTLRKLRENPL